MKTLISTLAVVASLASFAQASEFTDAVASNDIDSIQFMLEDGRAVISSKHAWNGGSRDSVAFQTYQHNKASFKEYFDVAPNEKIVIGGNEVTVRVAISLLDAILQEDIATGADAYAATNGLDDE